MFQGSLIRGVLLLGAFALEVSVLVCAGYWGFHLRGGVLGAAAAIGAPALFALVWGLFGAPKARYPARGPARAALETAWFGGAFALAAGAGRPGWAALLAAAYLLDTAGLRLTGSRTPGGAGRSGSGSRARTARTRQGRER